MAKNSALKRLQEYWLRNEGADYLLSLLGLRKDIPFDHRFSDELDQEIEDVREVHDEFIAWTKSEHAQRRLRAS